MALLADLEVQDHAAVRLGVLVVPVLAVEVARDVEQLLPGRGRRRQVVAVLRLERLLMLGIGQGVLAIVQHLAVGVVQDAIAFVAPFVQGLERRRHRVVGPLRIFAGRHQVVDREAVAGRRDVAIPEGADHEGVILAGAVPEIEHHLGIVLGERQLDDVELAAGQLLPNRPERVQRARDAALGTARVDGHRDLGALERLLVGAEQAAQLVARGGDHHVVVVGPEQQLDRAVVVPAHALRRGAGRDHDRHERRGAEQPGAPDPHRPDFHGHAPLSLDPRRRLAGSRGRSFAVLVRGQDYPWRGRLSIGLTARKGARGPSNLEIAPAASGAVPLSARRSAAGSGPWPRRPRPRRARCRAP